MGFISPLPDHCNTDENTDDIELESLNVCQKAVYIILRA